MKRIFLSLLTLGTAAVLAVSCNKDMEKGAPAVSPKMQLAENSIYFGVREFSTRSVVEATAASVQSHGFAVAASAFNASSDYYSTYFNRYASYNSTDEVYLMPAIYYYPAEGHLDIYAAAFNGPSATMTAFDAKNEAGKLADLPISISEESGYEGQASLAWSFAANDERDIIFSRAWDVEAQGNAQNMAFYHGSSQLAFTALGADANVTYKLHYLGAVAPKSGEFFFDDDFVYTADATPVPYTFGSWTRSNELSNVYATDAASSNYVESVWCNKAFNIAVGSNLGDDISTSSATAITGSYSFIPGNVQLKVEWSCWKDDVCVGHYTRYTAGVSGKVGTPIALAQGKRTTVNLTLPNDEAAQIKFTISVAAWQDASQDVTMSAGQEENPTT